MKKIVLLILALAIVVPAFAKDPPEPPQVMPNGCPIYFERIRGHFADYNKFSGFRRDGMELYWRNVSGKDIEAVELGFIHFDAFDEPDDYARYKGRQKATFDQSRHAQGKWQKEQIMLLGGVWIRDWLRSLPRTDVYVKRVKFADGTYWKDDGERACNKGIEKLNIARYGGLKAIAAKIADIEKKTTIKGEAEDEPETAAAKPQ